MFGCAPSFASSRSCCCSDAVGATVTAAAAADTVGISPSESCRRVVSTKCWRFFSSAAADIKSSPQRTPCLGRGGSVGVRTTEPLDDPMLTVAEDTLRVNTVLKEVLAEGDGVTFPKAGDS